MSLAQIRYFVAVAEERNMGRAAQRLHLSQPPLTRQIRALEEELGAPLFERTPRGMRLLPSGERFLPHARQVLRAVDAAAAAVASSSRHTECEAPPERTAMGALGPRANAHPRKRPSPPD